MTSNLGLLEVQRTRLLLVEGNSWTFFHTTVGLQILSKCSPKQPTWTIMQLLLVISDGLGNGTAHLH